MHVEKTKVIIKGNKLKNVKRINYKDKEILHS